MILGFKDVLSGFAFYMIHLGFQLKAVLKKTNQTNKSVVFCNKNDCIWKHFCFNNVVNVFISKTYPSAGELSAMAGLKSAV